MLKISSKVWLFIVSLIVTVSCKSSAQNNDPVVRTNKGYIRGVTENGISVFKGVPYAAPPLGVLRFKPTVEHADWNDTLNAQKFGAIACQPAGTKVIGSEDCLSLNVYTPKADHQKRAVMVWVHGGSMTAGAGKGEDGHAFADHDNIVTVTINYRLGVFGFMYIGETEKNYRASGNNGVLDCIMALKWIKQNIAAFGGDPDRVTVMGESAGAKLLSAVLVSPESKGLFQQYIAESGSAQCIRDTITAKNERIKIMKQLGLKPGDTHKLLVLPADSLIKAQAIVCNGIGGNSFFGPVNDGVVINGDAYQYAAGKNLPRIKALIGTNKVEAALFTAGDEQLKHPDTTILKSLFGDNYPMVYRTYLLELKTLAPDAAAIKVLTQYMFQMHSYRFAKALAQNGIPVWMYRFDFSKGALGAAHASELQYVWNAPQLTDVARKQMADNMHGAWVAFIKTGNPDISILPKWPNYKNNSRHVMVFDAADHVENLKDVFDDKNFPSAVFVLKSIN